MECGCHRVFHPVSEHPVRYLSKWKRPRHCIAVFPFFIFLSFSEPLAPVLPRFTELLLILESIMLVLTVVTPTSIDERRQLISSPTGIDGHHQNDVHVSHRMTDDNLGKFTGAFVDFTFHNVTFLEFFPKIKLLRYILPIVAKSVRGNFFNRMVGQGKRNLYRGEDSGRWKTESPNVEDKGDGRVEGGHRFFWIELLYHRFGFCHAKCT